MRKTLKGGLGFLSKMKSFTVVNEKRGGATSVNEKKAPDTVLNKNNTKTRIEELRKKIEDADKAIESSDRTIEDFKNKIEDNNKRIVPLENELGTLGKRIANMTSQSEKSHQNILLQEYKNKKLHIKSLKDLIIKYRLLITQIESTNISLQNMNKVRRDNLKMLEGRMLKADNGGYSFKKNRERNNTHKLKKGGNPNSTPPIFPKAQKELLKDFIMILENRLLRLEESVNVSNDNIYYNGYRKAIAKAKETIEHQKKYIMKLKLNLEDIEKEEEEA